MAYTTKRKHKVIEVDKKIYPGIRKRFAVTFQEIDKTGRERPIWKDFDDQAKAIEYINEIEKLI